MKRQLLIVIAVAIASIAMASSAFAGSGKGGIGSGKGGDGPVFPPAPIPQDGVSITNENEWTDEADDVAIRVWVLTAEQAETPPATKAEAEAVTSSVTYPGVFFEMRGLSGTNVIVASDEADYQQLAADDAFTAGTNYSTFAVEIEEGGGRIPIVVRSSDDEAAPPEISEGGELPPLFPFDSPF